MHYQVDGEDFQEMLGAYRLRYISCEIGDNTFQQFLARNGYNATEIRAELDSLRDSRKKAALAWAFARRDTPQFS